MRKLFEKLEAIAVEAAPVPPPTAKAPMPPTVPSWYLNPSVMLELSEIASAVTAADREQGMKQ
jgi:hypothetical protein